MIIKKFQGKTEADATNQAKAELGDNVVIMNVKSSKRKGFLSWFKKPLIEVTVALEEEQDLSYGKVEKSVKREPKPVNPNVIIDEEPPKKPLYDRPLSSAGPAGEKVIEEKLESLHSLLEQQLIKDTTSPDQVADGGGSTAGAEDDAFFKLIYNTLIDNEVDEKYVNELIDEAEKINKPSATIDFVLANIYQKMILKFGRVSTIGETKESAKVLFFIGPTGVGKTTTIAKLASKLKVVGKKKIALLTTDTYRIAAAEQLRTYAGILEAPFRVIYTAEELNEGIESFKSYDYILIDTAGHSHNNENQKNDISELINSTDPSIDKEVYLVLSATTKYRDLINISDTYSKMTEYKLIFTKLDETTTLGNLYNIRLHTKAAMSYVTCGQNVPDDIEKFSPQSTVKQLLGGR